MNFVEILRNRTEVLKGVLGKVKESEAEKLNKRVLELEKTVAELEGGKASKKDVQELRKAVVEGTLGDLNKAVKRQERRGELVRLSLSEVDLLFPHPAE